MSESDCHSATAESNSDFIDVTIDRDWSWGLGTRGWPLVAVAGYWRLVDARSSRDCEAVLPRVRGLDDLAIQIFSQLRRKRSLHGDPLPRSGAGKRNAMGVQEVAAERAGRSAVQFVAGHRMPDARQMHSDLVRAAGPDVHFEQLNFSKRRSTLYSVMAGGHWPTWRSCVRGEPDRE